MNRYSAHTALMSWPIWLVQRFSAALWTIGNWGTVYSACLPCWSCRSCRCRMKREVVHQMSGDILYAWAATEINAHKRTDDFAVLLTIQPASHTEGWVDYRWELGVKLLHYWKKYLQKERVPQILLLPLLCLSGLIHILICNTEIGIKSDMVKLWATFCCSGTYKIS